MEFGLFVFKENMFLKVGFNLIFKINVFLDVLNTQPFIYFLTYFFLILNAAKFYTLFLFIFHKKSRCFFLIHHYRMSF